MKGNSAQAVDIKDRNEEPQDMVDEIHEEYRGNSRRSWATRQLRRRWTQLHARRRLPLPPRCRTSTTTTRSPTSMLLPLARGLGARETPYWLEPSSVHDPYAMDLGYAA